MTQTCEHLFSCSGCSLPLQTTEPHLRKRIEEFLECPLPLFSENSPGWRWRARLAIRKGKGRQPALGLFKKKSHELVEIPRCQAHHPSINQAALLLQQEMNRHPIEPYDEVSGRGSLRYAQFFVSREDGRVQLALVSKEKEPALLLAKQLWRQSPLWHSIWINRHPDPSNTIFGSHWLHCFGKQFLRQKIGRAEIAFHPGSFSQAHFTLFDRLLSQVEGWVEPNTKLLEVYAGAGAISLHLAPHLHSATLIEENPHAHLSFEQSAPPASFSYLCGDAKSAICHLNEADLILLDPPRKGVDRELLEAIRDSSHLQMIYISCSFDSFERDAKVLLAAGWEIEDIAGYWLFPGTEHIELASKWKKKSGRGVRVRGVDES